MLNLVYLKKRQGQTYINLYRVKWGKMPPFKNNVDLLLNYNI